MMSENRLLNAKLATLLIAGIACVNRAVSQVLQWLVRLYQLTLSPFIGNQCRFHPTCSHYAMESLQRHGPWRGSWLAATRLGRCHPLAEGGIDLVPDLVPDSSPAHGLPPAQQQLNKQLQPHVEEAL